MRDNDRGAIAHDSVKSLLDQALRFFIESTRCFIKKKNAWLPDDGPSDGNPLLLATGELASTIAGENIEAWVEFWFKQ